MGAHAGGEAELLDALEIFGKDVSPVLTLVEDLAAEIEVLRAVAVGGIRCSGGEARVCPPLYIVGLQAIRLVAVLDVGMDVGDVVGGVGVLLKVVGIGMSVIQRGAEIDNKGLLVSEMQLEISRERGRGAEASASVGELDIALAVAEIE